jgi:hypothetical protein
MASDREHDPGVFSQDGRFTCAGHRPGRAAHPRRCQTQRRGRPAHRKLLTNDRKQFFFFVSRQKAVRGDADALHHSTPGPPPGMQVFLAFPSEVAPVCYARSIKHESRNDLCVIHPSLTSCSTKCAGVACSPLVAQELQVCYT